MKHNGLKKLQDKKGRRWGRRAIALLLAVNLLTGSFLTSLPRAEAASEPSGATYFTDTDNWGGGAPNSPADGDLDIGIKNQNKAAADNYSKYPVEFKITNVAALPTKSAHLLIRALDVDEYDTPTSTVGNGEWDRVYFSSNPADIAFGPSYTTWPTTSKWTSAIAGSGIPTNGQGYKQELKENAYLGVLSGKDEVWNTSVLTFKPEDFKRISLGDNYVGVTIHHFYKDLRNINTTPNTNWQMTVDWGQLIIDGGSKRTGEITDASVKVENGKVTIDTSFLPKLPGKNYSIEVNVIEKRTVDGEEVEKNLGLDQKLFQKPGDGVKTDWKNITISDPTINPNKEYRVNIILFDDRGGGRSQEKNTNSGEAQHIYSFSTFDPTVKDITKPGLQYDPTNFTAADFTSKYYQITGKAQPEKLEKVKIVTLPTGGALQLQGVNVQAGDEIAKADLGKLAFVPAASGLTGTASFNWNGYDGAAYAALDATATITANAAPIVTAIEKTINQRSTLVFTPVDFTSHFTDTTIPAENLNKVKITSLPNPTLGTLWFTNGANPAVKVTADQEINPADLGKLSFIPEQAAIGQVVFGWNGSDGKQYAKDNSSVNININAAPVVSDIAYAAIAGTQVELKANDFANADAYTDEEQEALSRVRIQLPADFGTKGNLLYTSSGIGKQIPAGTSTELNLTELNSLRFVPAAGLAENSTVVFNWFGHDGRQYSLGPAKVTITYTNDPVVSNIAKAGLQYVPISFTADDFKTHYAKANGSSDAEGLAVVKVVTLPDAAQGSLKLDGKAVAAGDEIPVGSLAKLAFVPASSGFTGIANFNWNGYNGAKYAALDATVTITANAAPIVTPIEKAINQGTTLAFIAADFTSQFTDATIPAENLNKVKIISLPSPVKGTLWLTNGANPAVQVTAGQEINSADLGKLSFVPEQAAIGPVSFGWNGSDGKQYAKDKTTITININAAPVVSDIAYAAIAGTEVELKANDFANADAYTDEEQEALSRVQIHLPADFATKGQLLYTSNGLGKQIPVGTSTELNLTELNSLRFEPAAGLMEESTVIFTWYGHDGRQFSFNPAKVTITYTNAPVVSNIEKAGLQYEPISFTAGDFKTHYAKANGSSNAEGLAVVKIVTLPNAAQGSLKLDGKAVAAGDEIPVGSLAKLAFVPASGGFTGIANFDWNGYDGVKYAVLDATVTITANAAPIVTPIEKTINQGTTLAFIAADFTSQFTDTTIPAENLNKVKIISLPNPVKGTLWFTNGSNPAVKVTVGQEINFADLGKLSFVPEQAAIGQVVFGWNGSDGKQYAKDNTTITININAAPVVSDIAYGAIAGAKVDLKANDFANVDAYTDADQDALSKVRIQLPADFATKGKLLYTSVGIGKQIPVGASTELNLTELNSLRFEPAAGLAENSTVEFNWYGHDGRQYSLGPAKVTIAYTNDPVVSNIAKAGLQYEPISITADDFKAHYAKANGSSNAEGLAVVKIVTLPNAAQGSLQLDGTAVAAGDEIPVGSLAKLAFVPASSGFTDIANFDWNGYDGVKYAALDATVTITANAAPVVDPINRSGLKGEAVPFATADFTRAYSDYDKESLSKVKLVSLPAADKGLLIFHNSDGTVIEISNVGHEIAASDLGKLAFIPARGVTGIVTFDWNGSDGNQYAKDSKKVTITINTPPVVGDINKAGNYGVIIDFKALDFEQSPRYTDADGDPLKGVAISLPADFHTKGTLWYSPSVGQSVYVEPGNTATLATVYLDTLKFQPSASLPDGDTVTFDWMGSDGKQLSEVPAQVNIAYNGKPVAEAITVNVTEGTSEVIIIFKGKDRESVTEIVYGLESNPSKGTISPADDNVSGDTWIYKPNPNFISGQDSFTYNVTDGDNQTGDMPATVTINIHKLLDGWVGDKAQGDPTVLQIIPGEQLGLAAVSSWLAEGVTANVNGDLVPLTLANPGTFVTDGYKKWINKTYLLPADTAGNQYKVTFAAVDVEQRPLSGEPTSRLTDNHFEVVKADLSLSANPDKILGDGKSTTDLSALLTNADGTPIVGVTVVFTAPAGKGDFVGGNTAVTNEKGIAVVTYKSQQITGVSEQQIPIQAIVHNKERGLKAQDEVIITFLPAAVKGFITKGDTNTPIAGASVRVTLDLDGDGIITPGVDFDETVFTDASGAYYVIVPKGDVAYDLEISQLVDVGGVPTPVTYKQKAEVGVVTGAGEENFDSEKTVTGIVLLKKPSGASSLFSGDLLAKTHIYVKKADGTYVLEGGVPKAFDLNGQGVFHADGLAIGDYELEIRYEIEPGKTITFSRAAVSVRASGELNISEELVDPYGTITDSVTKAVIEGAEVELHYADTARNIGKGIAANAKVVLPVLVGFDPNDNASPLQLSDAHGFYAYMVYPETDYYLLVTKNGYQSYKSPVLSVEWDIVRHDLELTPFPTSTPSGPTVNPALTLSVDKNKVKEGTKSIVTVDYKNTSSSTLAAGEIKVTIPADAVIIDAAGGTVTGKTIVWNVVNVPGGQGGSYKITLEWPLMKAADTAFDIPAELLANGVSIKSSVKINVFSERFGELTHYRYILGYPDKEFKAEGSLTRAELAAIVARLTENVNIDSTLPFSDIREGHWATNYIKIAVKHNYFSGYEDGTFRPDAAVTRGELASVMARFLKLEVSEPTTLHFKDTTGHWAANTIEALYNGKFLNGYPDGSFKPKNAIIRVEAVTMINRMLYRGPLQGLAPLFPDMPQSHWGFGDVQEATFSHKAERNEDGSEKWVQTVSDDVK